MSRNRIILVTIGIMLSLFLASMESTVVATAMPTIVGQLGGLEHYSWVFSAYMLASTTAVPLYGKLSDIYGRRRIYVIAMSLFLIGSVMSGLANSMTQLIFARAVQGLGAGGIMPLAFILIGEMFNLQQRAKMQGFFSGVWGFSSIVGPLLGGFLVDQFTWRWVFYINILPGLLAAALVALAWQEQAQSHERPKVDYLGAALLTSSVVSLLLGLTLAPDAHLPWRAVPGSAGVEFGSSNSWSLIALAVALFIALVWVESRAADPILPIHLFRDRLFLTAVTHGIFTGWAMFGSISFIPLFVQSVMGTSATQAGITITPMLLGWVTASVIGMRLILTVGHRRLGVIGTAVFATGAFLMTLIGAGSSQIMMMAFVTLMGIGMGLSIPSFLVAVQTNVERRHLGTATSTLQFSRSIGGTLGVSVMGAALSIRLASNLSASGLDPKLVTQLLDPLPGFEIVVDAGARLAMADSIHLVFIIAFVSAALGLAAVFFTPHQELKEKSTESELPVASMD
ncbi:MAG: MDR family MFS transporter [Anaerolineales bacterium]|nr:MDR family MFS transporter [Anaerolineales bacterium]